MKHFKGVLIAAICIFFIACGTDEVAESSSERPHDPWIFRSVLDLKPRMITLALHKDLWIAYRTDQCAMYQAWQGEVIFDGPVYTTKHGPQPTSSGNRYLLNKYENPWFIQVNGKLEQAKAEYLGHREMDNQAEMMYELTSASVSNPIKVNEKVDALVNEKKLPVLQRTFTVAGVPSNADVVLKANFQSVIVKSNITTNGVLDFSYEADTIVKNRNLLNLDGTLTMNEDEPTQLDVTFLKEAILFNPFTPEEETEDLSMPEGQRLIAQSDCKTCHNKNRMTIGPAYVSIANRYETTEDNINLLTTKIKNGGSGVWGKQVMTPHPSLSNSSINKMVEYILSLRTEEVSSERSEESKAQSIDAVDTEDITLIPGLYTTVRSIAKTTTSHQQVNYNSKPFQAGILGKFSGLSGADFQGLSEYFSIQSEGYIDIQEAGEYGFRLWSDDGSALFIGGEKIIDNDGLHGAVYEEASLNLEPGKYPFKVLFFQGAGGMYLNLEWKKPGFSEYVAIPFDAIYHNREMRKQFPDLTLPMATTNKIPGNKFVLEEVHPSFDLYQARPLTFTPKVGGIDFLSDGSMIVSTWDAAGSVYRLENLKAEDPDNIQVTKIAQGLAEPLGVKVVDDKIYVMQKQEITRLVDSDGDKIIDEYQTLADDWQVSANFHEFGFGLVYKEGYLYATLATAIDPGGASTQPQIQDRGKVIKVNEATGELEYIASGLRTPNGIGIGYNDEIYVADNQGDWLPASKILHIEDGAWYGSRSVDYEGTASLTEHPPVMWLPQDEIGNSPSTPLYIDKGPYDGQMIHGEVTNGGIKRVFVEEIGGQYQGALFRFIQGLEAGVNRIAWGPDGDLYVGGIGSTGNWGQTGKLQYGLQRLSYNEKSTFEMLAIRAKSNGLEIEFTEPLQPGQGWSKSLYNITQFYYQPTANYGGPKLGETRLPIRSVNVSEDRTKVFLELAGMKAGHMIYVHLPEPLVSDVGNQMWSTEAWYNMNKLPRNNPGFRTQAPPQTKDNELTAQERASGWKLLFNGQDKSGWKGFNKAESGSSWRVNNGVLEFIPGSGTGGDIMTAEEFQDFELALEWKISDCGNSGIFYNVVEDEKYNNTYETGIEMQILDNTCHPDTKFETHRAGDLYDLKATKYVTVKPAGEWNKVKIVSKDSNYEFWLNGYKVVEYKMFTEEWNAMVANSKFKDWEGFGKVKKGHIALQDHSDPVYFKNIKIRPL